MRRFSCLLVALVIGFSLIHSAAQQTTTSVPNLIRYSGVLKDGDGKLLTARVNGVTFALYKQQDGGAPVWLETQNVTTDAGGQYSVLLGSTTASGLPGDLFAPQEQRWLGVQVAGQAEQPRVLLVSVPYAMRAAEADTLAGHSVAEFVTTDNLQSAVQQQLQHGATLATSTSLAAGTSPGSTNGGGQAAPTNGATNFVDSTSDQVVGVTQNGSGKAINASAAKGNAIVGTATATASSAAGVVGSSSAPAGYGMIATETATTGTSYSYGIYGAAASTLAIGIRGVTSATTGSTIGIYGSAYSSAGIGIKATAEATSGTTFGLSAAVFSPAGTAAVFQNLASSGPITGALLQARTKAGVQFSVDGSGNASAAGTLSGTQLISTVLPGTAPLQVASNTLVPMLNASLLGGNAASAFALAAGSPNYIQNTTSQQPGASFNISGNGTLGGLSANTVNSATSYQIGASNALSIGSVADKNLFVGLGAGSANVAGQGTSNTFLGSGSGAANTKGFANTFVGASAGQSNTIAPYNAFFGTEAGYSNTTGFENTFIGHRAGYSNTTGKNNAFLGEYAGISNISGLLNTFVGQGAGFFNTTGSSNIYVASNGCGINCNESNTIRIGTQGSDEGEQNTTYMAGIYSAATNSGVPVFIDSTGKLGTNGGSLGGVTSFNGRTGAVVPAQGDYGFPLLSGTLGNAQFTGTYSNPVTLSNSGNSFTGNGAGLSGVPVAPGSPNYIQNGTVLQANANFNISGDGTANSFNSATTFQISGSGVLSIGSAADDNVFLGVGAGTNNVAGYGGHNVFSGYMAGYSNTNGSGNVFSGYEAGYSNTIGGGNTFSGRLCWL